MESNGWFEFAAAFGVGRPGRECLITLVEFHQPVLTRGATGHMRLQGLPVRGTHSAGQEPQQFSVGRACVDHLPPPFR
jgi:hypothetical protein